MGLTDRRRVVTAKDAPLVLEAILRNQSDSFALAAAALAIVAELREMAAHLGRVAEHLDSREAKRAGEEG